MPAFLKISMTLFVMSVTLLITYAQQELTLGSTVSVKCGDIIEGEFRENQQTDTYIIDMKAGDQIHFSASPLGDNLSLRLMILDHNNNVIGFTDSVPDDNKTVEKQPALDSGVLSANGNYSIQVMNWSAGWIGDGFIGTGGIGVYTLYIDCTLRDSTIINAGDPIPAPTGEMIASPIPTTSPSPTLPDFSTAQNKPLIPGTPSIGAISPGGTELYSYTLDATSGGTLDLTFSKLSGNLNLSFVVISSDSQVLFQVNLLNLGELKTSLTLPSAGQYTIGVFRIDLLPPAAPEATAFQVQGTLNP